MNKTVEGHCVECGLEVVPGEHTGHKAHFTGAWVCHDCGALCDKGDEWEDGDDSHLWEDGRNAGYAAGIAQLTETLQAILDDQARRMARLQTWAANTTADRGSVTWGEKSGQFDQAQQVAWYVIGKAQALGLALDETLLDATLEKGDWI